MVKMELFNDVGVEGGITVESVRSFLNANKNNDIQFDISTLGGDLGTAITIHNLIKTHPKKTIANIVGLTASAGTVIAIACDEVQMSDNALFLIHNGWKEVTGNVYDMQTAAAELAKTDAIMIKMYQEKTGLQADVIKNLMKASDWMTPGEAKKYGFVNQIINSGQKIAASVLISGAQGKINNLLLTKLEQKMIKNPFKAPKAEANEVLNVLALKDGNQLLINAEAPNAGVEVRPLGAMGTTLPDGEYELNDGRTITVVGDKITMVMDPGTQMPDASIEQIVAAVTALVQPVMAEVESLKAAMANISSTHKPAKSTVVAPGAKVEVQVHDKVKAVVDGIRSAIVESRKA